MILVGCPILVAALWIAWLVLAVRRPRVSWFIVIPLLCWATFTVMKGKESIAWYLQEDWTKNGVYETEASAARAATAAAFFPPFRPPPADPPRRR